MKKAVLLPNIVGFPSESMRRYAAELEKALRELKDTEKPEWSFRSLECVPSEKVAQRFGGGDRGKQMADRHARFVLYPKMIKEASGADIYHVLDHSHTNLALVPPARQ